MRLLPSVLVFSLAALPLVGHADTLHLKNGDVIEGKIISQDDDELVIQIGKSGKMTFSLDQIEKIVKDNKTGESHGSGIKGRKRDPLKKKPPRKKPDPKRTPKGSPKKPLADNPYIDTSKFDPRADQMARGYIRRLTTKPKFRNRGRNALRNMGVKAGRPLLQLLSSDNAALRREGATLLGEIGYKPAVPRLLRLGLRDVDTTVRSASVASIRTLAKQNFKYFPNAVPRLRDDALKRWDKWWAGEAKKYGMEP